MRVALVIAGALLATPAAGQSGVDHAAIAGAASETLIAGLAHFSEEAAALHDAVGAACAGAGDWTAAEDRYRDAYAAWASVDFARFGPIEEHGAALSINFWPDKKNFVGRALRAMQSADETERADLAFLRNQSVAAQGFPALERLLFETETKARCPLATTVASFIAEQGQTVLSDWHGPDGWAALMRAPGPSNPVYRDGSEATAALYNAFEYGLEHLQTDRLGRPFGIKKRARPKLGEGWRSEQGLANIRAQFEGLRRFSDAAIAPALTQLDRKTLTRIWDSVEQEIERIPAPLSQAVTDPAGRVAVERTHRRLRDLRKWMSLVAAPALDIGIAFNAGDGD